MKISKITILIASGLILLIIMAGTYLLGQNFNKPKSNPSSIPYFSPGPNTSAPYPTTNPVPKELQPEQILQENYAKDRQEFLAAKPWISKLPLKAGNYFISYDPENDTLLVTLYYSSQDEKDKQIEQAKNNALEAIKNAGITLNQRKEFSEVLFK